MAKYSLFLFLFINASASDAGNSLILREYNGIKVGQKAPKFGSFDINDQGKLVGLERTLNEDGVKGLVLNVFMTSCEPCLKGIELLNLRKMSLEKLGIKIWLISFMEEKEVLEKFISKNKINLPVLLDKYGEILKEYGMQGEATRSKPPVRREPKAKVEKGVVEKSEFPKTFLIAKERTIKLIIGAEGDDYIELIEATFK